MTHVGSPIADSEVEPVQRHSRISQTLRESSLNLPGLRKLRPATYGRCMTRGFRRGIVVLPSLVAALLVLPAAAAAGPLTPELTTLATSAVAAKPPAAQAAGIGFPAEGPGSLAREGNRLIVEAHFGSGAVAAVDELKAAGAKVRLTSSRFQTVVLSVEPADLAAVAAVPGVTTVMPSRRPEVYGVEEEGTEEGEEASGLVPTESNGLCEGGSVISQGVAQLNVPAARAAFGARGGEETVGVISNSFDSATYSGPYFEPGVLALTALDDESSNDLPGMESTCGGQQVPVDVIEEGEGADEGRAMLQIIHDIAPHAELAFATQGWSELEFARNIERMAEPVSAGGAGADVIVDDTGFQTEPIFQEGLISVAIQRVTEEGVTYLTAAGNANVVEAGTGNDIGSWEAPAYRETTCPAAIAALPKAPDSCMNFSLVPDEPDPTFGMTFEAGEGLAEAELQWAEPWYGVETDLDEYLLDENGEVIFDRPVDNGSGEGAVPMPYESFLWVQQFDEEEEVQFVVGRCSDACDPDGSATATPRLRLRLRNGNSIEYPETEEVGGVKDVVGPTMIGHDNAKDAISVAAVNYAESATAPKEPEPYSSRGPAAHYFGPITGTTPAAALPEPEVLAKPDLTASDCGSNTFFDEPEADGWHFCGTSAAAPHAAAVAALMKQTEPLASPADIANAMRESATEFTAVNSPSAVGGGLLNADAAITALGGSPVSDLPSTVVEPVPVEAAVSPGIHFFGKVKVGKASASETFTLTDEGRSPLTIFSIEPRLGNASFGDYEVDRSDCLGSGPGQHKGVLQEHESCTIGVTFEPTRGGSRHTFLDIRASGLETGAFLRGIGTTPSGVEIEPGEWRFPDRQVGGGADEPRKFKIHNVSFAPAEVVGVRLEGAQSDQFTLSDPDACEGGTLGVLDGCTVEVAFDPTSVGLKEATLEVETALGSATSALTATATVAPPTKR